jgi:two-component system sensor histidine kinase UhpB
MGRVGTISVSDELQAPASPALPPLPVRLWRFLRPEPGYRRLSLYARVVVINAAVLTIATLAVALTPARIPAPLAVREAIVLFLGLSVIVFANAALLRLSFRPLGRLVQAMRSVDLLQPGSRLRLSGGTEVRQVITTFNEMLDRLELERQESNRRALVAREGERRRIGQELHDEIGQRLTGMLLQLQQTIEHTPGSTREELVQVQELARSTLDEVGRLAWQLRPGILDDLGLVNAIAALAGGMAGQADPEVGLSLERSVSALGSDAELVIYRIAQEGLTNAFRHAGASRLRLELRERENVVRLRVSDDGRGLRADDEEGAGIRGMRERALLIGAAFRIESAPGRGVTVQLDVERPDAGQ